MFMKIIAPISFFLAAFSVVFLKLEYSILNYILFSLLLSIVYMGLGVLKAKKLKVHPLNEGPNALRLFLAILGGFILGDVYLTNMLLVERVIFAFLLLCISLLLNDEWMRKEIRRIFPKWGFVLALLGIDGSGKSTYSYFFKKIFEENGFDVEIIRYHKYLFVERLSKLLRQTKREKFDKIRYFDSRSFYKGNKMLKLLRALLSLVDNILLYLFKVYPKVAKGKIVILDRFIWSTYIKYSALGYPLKFLEPIWFLIKPRYAIIFDIPEDVSIQRVMKRDEPIRYAKEVLRYERNMYSIVAKRYGYPIVPTTYPRTVTDKICMKLAEQMIKTNKKLRKSDVV